MEFSDDILSIEYEYFSFGFDVNVGLDVDLCAEYESFSLDPIQSDHFFENCKSKVVESKGFATKNFALNQIYAHCGAQRVVNFVPSISPRLIFHDNPISSPMTYQLASLNYICLFDVWDHTFEKLKPVLYCYGGCIHFGSNSLISIALLLLRVGLLSLINCYVL